MKIESSMVKNVKNSGHDTVGEQYFYGTYRDEKVIGLRIAGSDEIEWEYYHAQKSWWK